MRQKDFEQAILLEEKIALQLGILLHHYNSSTTSEELNLGVDSFLSNFGSYKDLVHDECDSIEIWKRVLITVQEISQLASSLYTAATGLPLSRSCSSVGERQSDIFTSPTLPKRAETFGGFDERRNKPLLLPRDAVLSTLPPGYFSNRENEKRESNASSSNMSEFDAFSMLSNTTSISNSILNKINPELLSNELLKDNNFAALQVSHHLHTLLCIISQQMTTIQSLQNQLQAYRDNPKTIYRHNDQLEELRNLQDRFQEEKVNWQKQVEHKEKEMEEQRKELKFLQEQTRKEQQDIQEQREQLYRKMEMLSNQGLLISPSVAIPVNQSPVTPQSLASSDDFGSAGEEHHIDGSGSAIVDRRKERWKNVSGEYAMLIDSIL